MDIMRLIKMRISYFVLRAMSPATVFAMEQDRTIARNVQRGWYMLNGQGCFDIDECVKPDEHCSDNQFCVNEDGGYSCLSKLLDIYLADNLRGNFLI